MDRGRKTIRSQKSLQSQKSEVAEEPDEKNNYGISFLEISSRKQKEYTTDWGPIGFRKANHPLAIMVRMVMLNRIIYLTQFSSIPVFFHPIRFRKLVDSHAVLINDWSLD